MSGCNRPEESVSSRGYAAAGHRGSKLIDLQRRILFIHIPKTAGRSIEAYFRNIGGLSLAEQGAHYQFLNAPGSSLERANDHCSLEMYENFFFGGAVPDDFRIFSVVRDPVERFWSEYRYRRIPSPKRFPISFPVPAETLIQWIDACPVQLKDVACHLRPQHTFLVGKSELRVRLLRFEKLGEDFSRLQQEWGLPSQPLPRENVSGTRRKVSDEMRLRHHAVLTEHYAEDIERFGYRCND